MICDMVISPPVGRLASRSFLLLLGLSIAASAQANFATRADTLVAPYAQVDKFWGTVLIASHGRTLFTKSYGMADLAWKVPNSDSSKYEIASLTKAFTGMAIVQLAAKGKLRIDDPISKYYAPAPSEWEGVTIEEVLTHTSGLPNNQIKDYTKGIDVPYTSEELMATFRGRPLQFAPGTRWAYTNTEYYLLAYLIEKLSGETYGDYLQHHIFGPLGMKDSGFAPTTAVLPQLAEGYARDGDHFRHRDCFDRSLEIGAGGVHSTVGDLLLWDQALYTYNLAPAGYMKQVFTPHSPGSYGYGWFVTGSADDRRIWHEGSDPGYAAFIIRRPAQQLFIVVLSNLEDAPVREIAGKLEKLALE